VHNGFNLRCGWIINPRNPHQLSGQSLRESGYTLTRVNLALFQPCVAHVIGANYSVGQLVTLAEAFSYV